uniref:Ig-like domain-containing protein n=1 Tax=Neogobius melanostomus TaxID=47308 RepID=A0A8C6TZ95_9GOBI
CELEPVKDLRDLVGWFPEPELVWLDSEGTVLTGARTEAQRGVNEETFSVSSRLSVEQSPGNSFTCRVRHQETRQSRENQIRITGQTLVVPSQPLVVPVGSEVTLPCQLESVKDLRDLVVDWARHDLKPRYIHIRRDGWDHLISQNSLYLGRTRLSERGLAYGDMSLTLSRVRLSDAGTYHCFIPQMDTRAEVTLHVGESGHTMELWVNGPNTALRCESRGWFPEPELVWLDSEGTVLTGARTEAQRGVNEETFSVSSRLSVEQSPGNSFTCRVRHQETRHEYITVVPGEFLEACSSCSVAWTLFVLGLILAAVAGAFVLWKYKTQSKYLLFIITL